MEGCNEIAVDSLNLPCVNDVQQDYRVTRSHTRHCSKSVCTQNVDMDQGYCGDEDDDGDDCDDDYIDDDDSISKLFRETVQKSERNVTAEYLCFDDSFDLEELLPKGDSERRVDQGSFDLEELLHREDCERTEDECFLIDDGTSVVRIDDDGFASLETSTSTHSLTNEGEPTNEDSLHSSTPLETMPSRECEELTSVVEEDDDSDSQHLCDMCGQYFSTLGTLNWHVRMQHADNIYATDPANETVSSDYIGIRSSTLNDLRADIPRSEAVRHMLGLTTMFGNYGSNGKLAFCEQCNLAFATKSALKTHEISAHASTVKRYLCGDCGKSYTSSTSLNAHMTMVHRRQRCMCEVCGKYYASKYYLKLHRKIHSETKDYTCGFCAKAFIDQQALRLHLRTHTGERPYRCPQCGLGFTQSSHLKTHSRLHTGEKPFSCRICGKLFRQQSNVMEHERTHMKGSYGITRQH